MLKPKLAFSILLVSLSGIVHASTLNVPSTYATIQAAVNAAGSGDTVVVAPGTYTGAGNFNIDVAKNITIQSSGGAASTIIDLTGATSGSQRQAFNVHNNVNASITGFTIQNGFFSDGGAITVNGANATISQSIFTGNSAVATGGAVYLFSTSSTTVTVQQSVFLNNTAGDQVSSPGVGGAIEINETGNGILNATIVNCVFIGNTAAYDGGAIDMFGGNITNTNVTITNASFSKNNANGFVASGTLNSQRGGLRTPTAGKTPGTISSYAGTAALSNLILYGDTTSSEYSTLNNATTGNTGQLSITNSDVQGTLTGTGASVQSNISADPLYVNANSDLRIKFGSPAINNGTNVHSPQFDLLGNPRDNQPDMGAYEYGDTVTVTSIVATNGNVFSGQVATVHESAGDLVGAGTFTASINWGDGSNASVGTLTQPGGAGTDYVVSGSHTYSQQNTYTLTVTVTMNNAPYVGTRSITVLSGTATHFSVTAPSTVTAGVAFNLTVTALTASNTVATAYQGLVSLTSSDGGATLPNLFAIQFGDGGVHTITGGVTLVTVGSQSINATDGSFTGTTSATVVAAAASHFGISTTLVTVAGGAYDATVTAIDPYGNVSTSYTGTISFTKSDGGAGSAVPANYTFVAGDHGVHTFLNGVTLVTVVALPAKQSVSVSDGTISGTASIQVTPNAPHHFIVADNFLIEAGSSVDAITKVVDQYGNLNPGYRGTVHFTTTDPGAAVLLPADYTFTNGDLGQHTFFGGVTFVTAGNQTVTMTDKATPSIKGTGPLVEVDPGFPTHYKTSGSSGGTGIAGVTFNITVTPQDVYNNTANFPGAVSVNSSDGQAVLPGRANTLSGGAHTYSVTLKTAGSQTVSFSNDGGGILVSFPYVVTADALAAILVTAPANVVAGVGFTFTAVPVDQFNNQLAFDGKFVQFRSSSAGGLPDNTPNFGNNGANLTTAGVQTLTVSYVISPRILGTATITVAAAAASKLQVTVPSTATAGIAFNATVTAQDAFNNTATSYLGTVGLTTNDPNLGAFPNYQFKAGDSGQHTFSIALVTAGSRNVSFTDSSISGSGSLTVNAGSATTFSIPPTQTVTAGVGFTLNVTPVDPFGNVDTTFNSAVIFNSSDASAVLPNAANLTGVGSQFPFTLKTAGTQSITVTGAGAVATISLTVNPAAASHFSVTVSVTPVIGVAFSVRVAAVDAFNNVVTIGDTFHFTSSSGDGTLPADVAGQSGLRTYPVTFATTGSRTITVSNLNNTVTGTSNSFVVSNPMPVIDNAFPPSALVNTGPVSFTIQAENVVAGATVSFNGNTLTPSSISAPSGLGESNIVVSIPKSMLGTPGVVQVTVVNPAPAVGPSSPTNFTITASCTVSLIVGGNFSTTNQGLTNGQFLAIPAGCPWTASSNSAFMTVSPTSGNSGNVIIGVNVSPNPGAPRQGTVTIAGITVTVNQDGGFAGLGLAPSSGSPGGTARIPVNLILDPSIPLNTLMFEVVVNPSSSPALPSDVSYQAATGTPAFTSTSAVNVSSRGIQVSYQNLSSPLVGTIHIGDVIVTIPSSAQQNQTYNVSFDGGVNSALSGANVVNLQLGGNSTLTVSSLYNVSDIYPSTSNSAGFFGDSPTNINTLDLLATLRLASGIETLPTCSDRFDAADSDPPDTPSQRGGNGSINVLDLLATLRRVSGTDPSTPTRTSRGLACPSPVPPAGVASAGRAPADTAPAGAKRPPVRAQDAEAVLEFGESVPTSSGTWQTPVYVRANVDVSWSGLALAVDYTLGDDEPQIAFVAGDGREASLTDASVRGKLAVAWLTDWSARAGDRVVFGYVETTTRPEAMSFVGASANAKDDGREMKLAFTSRKYIR